MELSDLFVSHKQVTPVEYTPEKPDWAKPIYFNLERARNAANSPDTTQHSDMHTWSVDNPVYNWRVEYLTKAKSQAHHNNKGGYNVTSTYVPTGDFNLYDWISNFELSRSFGETLSGKDLKGVDLKDAGGHKTFGYGLLYHPNGKYMDQIKSEWTQQELEDLYKQTVNNTRNKVLTWAQSKNVDLKDHQIDALTSAVYNFGPDFLNWSVARRIATNPNDEKIHAHWSGFSNHQADKYPGLVKRRKKEADRYFNRA